MNEIRTHPADARFAAAYAALPANPARAKAYAHFTQNGLPHRRMEAWKWTDVRQALARPNSENGHVNVPKNVPKNGPKNVPKNERADTHTPTRLKTPVKTPGNALVIEIVDGQVVNKPDLPTGITLDLNAQTSAETASPMVGLAQALAPACLNIHLDGQFDAPLFFALSGAGHTQINLTLAAKCKACIIEDHALNDGFANTAMHIVLGPDARLTRLVHQYAQAAAVQTVCAQITLGAAAQLQQFTLSFGARLARLETRLKHEGVGAKAVLNGAYMLADERHADQTYYVDHGAQDGVTAQLVRGVVKDKARGVFQGKFYVARAGQQTDAQMAHNAILLGDGASVNAKPELEIYADDVACAHGNTCGALDESALFYMRQRGLDEAAARTLLLRAFVGEAFDALGQDDLRDVLIDALDNWLAVQA